MRDPANKIYLTRLHLYSDILASQEKDLLYSNHKSAGDGMSTMSLKCIVSHHKLQGTSDPTKWTLVQQKF